MNINLTLKQRKQKQQQQQQYLGIGKGNPTTGHNNPKQISDHSTNLTYFAFK